MVSSDVGRAINCLDETGDLIWEREFEHDVERFVLFRDEIYIDGCLARRLALDTGETIAEREYGSEVEVLNPVNTGPVYYSRQGRMLLGLDPEDLTMLWEWPDPNEVYIAHADQLCRYDMDGEIHIMQLPTLREIARVRGPKRLALAGLHAHCGELWCEFCVSEKERVGIHTGTGATVWRHEGPFVHYLPVFVGNVAYSGGGGLTAYDLKTGGILWHQEFGQTRPDLACIQRIHGNRAYVGTIDGYIHVVDCDTGGLELSHEVGISTNAVAPLGANRIIVSSAGGLRCLEVTGAT